MGLTKRKDGYYVEFPIQDDGKTMRLARGVYGAKIRRWKTGTTNRTLAKQQEALIKTELLKGIVKSERNELPLTFKSLTDRYLAEPAVQHQVIYEKKKNWITKRFLPSFGSATTINRITATDLEQYLEQRRHDRGYQGTTLKAATLNRELACLKHLFSWAVRKGFLEQNPAQDLKQEKEGNIRDEILEPDQFAHLQQCSPPYLRPINVLAYVTGMRLREILGLTWVKLDFKRGFIRLGSRDTKTREGRIIPLSLSTEMETMLRSLADKSPPHVDDVFLRRGKPIRDIREAFETARAKAGLPHFRFHDLRHTAITNMRRAGIDHLTIMQITGHKTMVCFTRYNSFREGDLLSAAHQFNTYLTLVKKPHSKLHELLDEVSSVTT